MFSDVKFNLKGVSPNNTDRNIGYQEVKNSLGIDRIDVHPVSIKDQLFDRLPLGDDWKTSFVKHKNETNYFHERINEPEEKEYLDRQIDQFLQKNPELPNIIMNGDMETILDFGMKMVRAGTSSHSSNSHSEHFSDSFDINDPKKTKCNIFNSIFMIICERAMERYRPDLFDRYRLVFTKANRSLDLPRNKSENYLIKLPPHGFLTLVSLNDSRVLEYSSVDPYHENFGGSVAENLDYTSERSVDSFMVLSKLVIDRYLGPKRVDEPTGTRERINVVNQLKFNESIHDVNQRGELSLALCEEWKLIRSDFELNYKQYMELRDHIYGHIQTYKEMKKSGASKSLLKQKKDYLERRFSEGNDNYLKLRFKTDFFSEIKDDYLITMEQNIRGLAENIIESPDKIDPKSALIFFDLLDTIDYYEIPIRSELLDDVAVFLKDQRENNLEAWKKTIKSRRGKSDPAEHLVRHYDNKWDVKPNEIVMTANDREQVEEGTNHYRHLIVRAEVLKLMRECGVNDWKKFIPKETEEGTYARLLVDLLNESD